MINPLKYYLNGNRDKLQLLINAHHFRVIDENTVPIPKIILCSNGEIYGGAERQVSILYNELRSTGYNVSLLLVRDGEYARQLTNQEYPFDCLNLTTKLSFQAISRFRATISHNTPLILHTHGYQATVLGVIATMWLKGVKRVRTLHGIPERDRNFSTNTVKSLLYAFLESTLANIFRVSTIYVTRDLASRSHIKIGEINSVIYNGVDSPPACESKVPDEFLGKPVRILFAGRLSPVKGLDIAIRAIRELPKNQRPTLFILGTGPQEDQLKALTRYLGVEKYIIFLGFRSNIYPYLLNSNILLLPSRHEGLPYVMLEAMAVGVPTICSNVGGMAEILTNGETSLLYPAENYKALAGCIEWALESPREMKRMAKSAMTLQKQSFTSAVMAESYIALYSRISRNL